MKSLLRTPFCLAALSFLCYWISLAPLGAYWLVFLVPFFWYFLYFLPNETLVEKNSGKKEDEAYHTMSIRWYSCLAHFRRKRLVQGITSFYGQLWGAAFLFWLIITYWLTFPHPATSLGWLAMAGYLAFYFPLYIAAVRLIVSIAPRWTIPAALFFWVAMEWLKKRLLGGFSFVLLEHAFYRHPVLIQLADQFNEEGVGLFIMLVGMLLAAGVQPFFNAQSGIRRLLFCLLMILLIFWGNIQYGQMRINQWNQQEQSRQEAGITPFRFALLQEKTTFTFPVPEETNATIHRTYMRMSREAVLQEGPLDLIVWPESSFAIPFYDVDVISGGYFPWLKNESLEERNEQTAVILDEQRTRLLHQQEIVGAPLLLGVSTIVFDNKGDAQFYNSALLVDSSGEFPRYDKTELVMFGEYIPFANYLPDWFPLKTLCQSATPGKRSALFLLKKNEKEDAGGTSAFPGKEQQTCKILVNICFESSVARLFQRQINELRAQGNEPDILLNISNDGWFRHSLQIDYHLATNVFRAIENRKTVLSATHAGYSAWIDPTGQIRSQGKRNNTQVIIAEPIVIH